MLQISPSASLAEKEFHKSARAWVIAGPRRSEDVKMDSLVTNRSPCFHHARQVSRMIYVQMGQKNRVNFIEGEMKFTETGKGARTDIHKKPRLPVDNNSVATGSATVCAWRKRISIPGESEKEAAGEKSRKIEVPIPKRIVLRMLRYERPTRWERIVALGGPHDA